MATPDPADRETAAPGGDLRIARGRSTRAQLLAAAGDLLREEGYAATSMRAVADRADVRLSLVHYHFGSKRGLLVAVLEDLTERLLERQQKMFSDDRPFADQWRTACDHLREDIRSGYVRILWELWSAGLADPELAERWRATQRGWRELIEARLERLQAERGVELPMPPRPLATLIGNLFEGAETEILAGVPEDEAPHLEALEACAALIARAER
ncbi:TetR/AcrR family transcriptional regulator [Baekduia sp.]|jgi:AcrR family transcriptional regulator|uniref:TetR/AcrR family transcriptional regulator n=1 Tax=Baekduia sp. TaxID=2600305 RepID=UPI002E0C4149|nr:TetR/AcrR family transcriptional regulator [Baekduia sp.]